jgi:CrcB protein
LAANLFGSALLGVVVVLATHGWPHLTLLRPFLGTGFLGGFTTFSTLTAETWALAAGAKFELAVVYPLVSLVGGLAGLALAHTMTHQVNRHLRGRP